MPLFKVLIHACSQHNLEQTLISQITWLLSEVPKLNFYDTRSELGPHEILDTTMPVLFVHNPGIEAP